MSVCLKNISGCAVLLVAHIACSDDAAPLHFTLDAQEYRSVELLPTTRVEDWSKRAEEWSQRAGVEPLELLPLANGGAIVRFAMDEGVWRAKRGALCTETGVAACDTDFCQSYQEAHTARVQAEDGRGLNGRLILVPRAPDVAQFFGDQPIATSDALPGEASCPKIDRGAISFAATNANGVGTLADATMIDRGCYELIAASSCAARTRPVSDVLPEIEPRRVLVIVNLTNQAIDAPLLAALNATPGVRVIETVELTSINKSLVRLELPDAALDAVTAITVLGAIAGVESAQPEYRHRTTATFDDPYAWMNYSIRMSGADALHPKTMGEGVEVAVIDTGVDVSHPELAARVSGSVDVTGFGMSADRHGTAMAGVIAAQANNTIGAYGIAPLANIYAIKACQPESKQGTQGRCWSSTLAKALDAAIKRGSRIINLSLSGPKDPLVEQFITTALAQSRLVIAAAGNGGPDAAPSFPASMPGVLAVTAVDSKQHLYAQATRGEFVDLAAPGVSLPVPVPGETYPGQLSGTSLATASASAVAALVMSQQPSLTGEQVRSALESSAIPQAGSAPKNQLGHGRIDACAALKSLAADVCVEPPTTAVAKESR